MALLIFILLFVASVILGFIILIQNPKGGGLSGSIGGMSNQIMGVKQTNDIMEKGTWIFAGVIALICIFSTFLLSGSRRASDSLIDKVNTTAPAPMAPATGNTAPFNPAAPAQQAPAVQPAPVTADTGR